MRFIYDSESGAMYVRIKEGKIAETLELGGGCYLDVDENGTVMGLECLSLDEFRELIVRNDGELHLPDRMIDAEKIFEISESDTLPLEKTLDPAQKRVGELRFVDGLSYEEIADVLGVSIPTVLQRLRSEIEAAARSGHTPDRIALYDGGRLLLND